MDPFIEASLQHWNHLVLTFSLGLRDPARSKTEPKTISPRPWAELVRRQFLLILLGTMDPNKTVPYLGVVNISEDDEIPFENWQSHLSRGNVLTSSSEAFNPQRSGQVLSNFCSALLFNYFYVIAPRRTSLQINSAPNRTPPRSILSGSAIIKQKPI